MRSVVTRLKRTEDPAIRQVLLRARALPHYGARGHLVRRSLVRRYLRSEREPKLEIGAGPNRLPGWLDSDLIGGSIYLDLGRRLPFRDRTFAFAFGEHVIEHLSDRAGERLLRELHRIIRPGGVLRLTTPDLRKLVALYEDRHPTATLAEYSEQLDATTGRRHARAAQVLNDKLRLWGHRWIYDEEDLTARLLAAGFRDVARREPGESAHAALRGVERHGASQWLNRVEAMCLEATRPG